MWKNEKMNKRKKKKNTSMIDEFFPYMKTNENLERIFTAIWIKKIHLWDGFGLNIIDIIFQHKNYFSINRSFKFLNI